MANLSNINNKFIVTDGGDVMINNTIAGYPNGEGLTVKSSDNISRVVLQNSVSGGSVNDGFRIGLVNSNVEFESAESGEFQFYTGGGTAKMTIKSDGNVGIGVNAPNDGKLQVYGNSSSDWGTYIYNQHANGIGLHVETNSYSTEQLLRLSSVTDAGGGNSVRMLVRADGNVGIGTTTPDDLLNIESALTNKAVIRLGCTYNGAGWVLGDVIGAVNFFSLDDSGPGALVRGSMALVAESTSGGDMGLSFSTYNNTERVRITATGRMGIGTTTPNTALQVNQATTVPLLVHRPSNTNFDPHGIGFSTRNDAANGGLGDVRSGIFSDYNGDLFLAASESSITTNPLTSSRLFIEGSNGNVGIGTVSPDTRLHIVGPGGAVNPSTYSVFDVAIENVGQSDLGIIGTTYSGIYFGDAANVLDGALVYYHVDNHMSFRTNGNSEKMRITSSGGISFGSSGTSYGSSGQVLISNGNVSPSWGTATSVSEDNYWKIDDGLNFHLAFKEGSGTTVADIGGGRNNFTGTATWTQTGRFGYALDFNGTSQYLGGTGPSSNVTTFSAWINNDGGGGIQNIVSGSYIMGYVSIYSNRFNIYDGTAWRDAGAIPLNEWVHVAFSYDASGNAGGLQKMYINGVLGYSATAVGYTGQSSYISHVGMYAGAIRYFNGEITNIQTWDRILGDSEIQSLYNKYSGYGGSVSEASLWTLKPLTANVYVNGNLSVNDFTFSYSYPATHALYISGGVTTTPASSGVSYSAHFTIKVDNNDVALVDQHETPPEWWRQSWAFMTPSYSPGSHLVTFNALNQDGDFNMIGGAIYSQIVYRIIPL